MTVVLGIDPGSSTGLAIFRAGKLAELRTVEPAGIEAQIVAIKPSRVVFEDSRLQSHTWATAKAMSRAAAVKIARNVGQIDAWCSLVTAICAKHSIPAHGISPKAKGSKTTAEQFERLTGWTCKSNQHERDSALVAWPYRSSK